MILTWKFFHVDPLIMELGRTTRILPVTHDLCLGYCFLLVANGLQLAGHDKASTVERILKRLQPTNPDIPSLPRDTVFADRGYNDQRRTMSVLRATHAKLMGTAKSGPKNCHSIDDSSQDEKIFVNSYGAETFYVASNTEEEYAQALYCTGKAKGELSRRCIEMGLCSKIEKSLHLICLITPFSDLRLLLFPALSSPYIFFQTRRIQEFGCS